MENTPSIIDNEQLLLQTVAKGATKQEFQMFLEFCKSTGLNPYKKEIWFIKTGAGVQMMTGINGFLTIANNHPQFDGMEVSINEVDGKLVSATASVYRKDRKFPSTATVFLSEYAKPSKYGNGLWDKMPRMMLQKVAKSVALREAFPQELNGMYTQEEMPEDFKLDTSTVKVVPAPKEVSSEPKKFIYNLSLILDEEKKSKIIDWVSSNINDGFSIVTENTMEYLVSPREISKLKEFRVNNIGDGI